MWGQHGCMRASKSIEFTKCFNSLKPSVFKALYIFPKWMQMWLGHYSPNGSKAIKLASKCSWFGICPRNQAANWTFECPHTYCIRFLSNGLSSSNCVMNVSIYHIASSNTFNYTIICGDFVILTFPLIYGYCWKCNLCNLCSDIMNSLWLYEPCYFGTVF